MKFYLVDDMHLEFSQCILPGDPDATLLLAGDITTVAVYKDDRTDASALKLKPRFNEFFKDVSSKFKNVFYVAGNHEYYHWSWEETIPFMRLATHDFPNIQVLDKEWVDLGDDVMLYGATFWTDFGNNNPIVISEARRYMNDYRLITESRTSTMYGKSTGELDPGTVLHDHWAAKKVLEEGLVTYKDKKVVVMTHHAPSLRSTHPRYGGTNNPINWAYCSELDYFVEQHPQIKYWVHGHTHDSHAYKIAETQVYCNPRGYSYHLNGHDENPRFDDKLNFEV